MAVVFSLLAGLALTTAPVHAARPATLRIVRSSPLILRGASFRGRETVRIVVRMGTTRRTKTARATRAGTFRVRFSAVTLDYCAVPLTLVARGELSGIVRARIPLRECAAP